MHLTHDDLVLHFYGESSPPEAMRVDAHLAECAECRAALARLQQVLEMVDTTPVEEPPPGYEATVWARLQDNLASAPPWWQRFSWGGALRWAPLGATAALLVGAFAAGWLARDVPAPQSATAAAEPSAEPVRTRVLLVAVGDHLERSEMVLSEVLNATDAQVASLAGERARASDLVAASRLYRQTATMTGDDVLEGTLEDLERVLLEIANGPADVTEDDLRALREQIESRGLLFRVRVLTNDLRARDARDAATRQKGPTL